MSCGLRDVLEFEKLGRPAILVASEAFVDAADKQAAMLGAPDARRAFVGHPIQDRSDDELQQLARSVADELLAKLQVG